MDRPLPALYAAALWLLFAQAAGAAETRNVLVLYSNNRLVPGNVALTAELRARGARSSVIRITAHDTPSVRVKVARSGAVAYLPRPFAGSASLAGIERISGSAVSS